MASDQENNELNAGNENENNMDILDEEHLVNPVNDNVDNDNVNPGDNPLLNNQQMGEEIDLIHDEQNQMELAQIGFVDSDGDSDDPNENIQNDFIARNPNRYRDEDEEYEGDTTSSPSNNGSDNQDGHNDTPPPSFDNQLPLRHVYLGDGMEELQGRTVIEEGSIHEIPLVVMNIQLIPGQTLPMTVFHAVFQNAIRRCVVNNRVFGVVSNENWDEAFGRTTAVSAGSIGTLVEIYEFQEESENHNPMQPLGSSFAIKAKARYRFNVIEVRRQSDGNLMGTVKIRPEVVLPDLMSDIYSHSTLRYQFPLQAPSNSSSTLGENEPRTETITDDDSIKTDEEVQSKYDAALNELVDENARRKKISRHYSIQTPWPSFVYENFEERVLVERMHKLLKYDLKGIIDSQPNIPFDGTELSFWLAQNLTMDDPVRLQLLAMDSSIQRLRYELNLLKNFSRSLVCRACKLSIADQKDIFAMSVEGPQGTYVNPAGYVHETMTVTKVREVVTRGHSSTEASWFPGYSWQIVECRRCKTHLGWKFVAIGRIQPKKFWGLARRAVTFKYEKGDEVSLDIDFDSSEDGVRRMRRRRIPPLVADEHIAIRLFPDPDA